MIRKSSKKVLALITAIIMVVSLVQFGGLAVTAFADENEIEEKRLGSADFSVTFPSVTGTWVEDIQFTTAWANYGGNTLGINYSQNTILPSDPLYPGDGDGFNAYKGEFVLPAGHMLNAFYMPYNQGFDLLLTSSNELNEDVSLTLASSARVVNAVGWAYDAVKFGAYIPLEDPNGYVGGIDWEYPAGKVTVILYNLQHSGKDITQYRIADIFYVLNENYEVFTAAFDLGYSGGTPPVSQLIEKNGLVERPADPVREGYAFNGWYNDDAEWNFDTDEILDNLVLTAAWIELEVIDFSELKDSLMANNAPASLNSIMPGYKGLEWGDEVWLTLLDENQIDGNDVSGDPNLQNGSQHMLYNVDGDIIFAYVRRQSSSTIEFPAGAKLKTIDISTAGNILNNGYFKSSTVGNTDVRFSGHSNNTAGFRNWEFGWDYDAGVVTIDCVDKYFSYMFTNIVLTGLPELPIITSSSLPDGNILSAYSAKIFAYDDDLDNLSWSVTNGALPNGISLNNGILSGAPTEFGTFNFTVKVQNLSGSFYEKAFVIEIVNETLIGFDELKSAIVSNGGAMKIVDIDPFYKGITWGDNIYVSITSATINGESSAAWTFDPLGSVVYAYAPNNNISTIVFPDGAMLKKIDFAGRRNAAQNAVFSSSTAGNSPQSFADGNIAFTTYSFPWTNEAGAVTIDNLGAHTGYQCLFFDNLLVSGLPLPPAIITGRDLPLGKLFSIYGVDLNVYGSSSGLTWSVVSGTLPAGLTLSNGRIAGTPTQAGIFTFTVKIQGSEGQYQKEFTVEIINEVVITFEPLRADIIAFYQQYSKLPMLNEIAPGYMGVSWPDEMYLSINDGLSPASTNNAFNASGTLVYAVLTQNQNGGVAIPHVIVDSADIVFPTGAMLKEVAVYSCNWGMALDIKSSNTNNADVNTSIGSDITNKTAIAFPWLGDTKTATFFLTGRTGAGPMNLCFVSLTVNGLVIGGNPVTDLNGDGQTDSSDLAVLLDYYGKPASNGADIDGDGQVDSGDLSLLLDNYGK